MQTTKPNEGPAHEVSCNVLALGCRLEQPCRQEDTRCATLVAHGEMMRREGTSRQLQLAAPFLTSEPTEEKQKRRR